MRTTGLSWQTYVLAALCVADLISTVWLCRVHNAAEANPIMAYFLSQGVLAFAAAKVAFTAAPLALLEWVRRGRPRLAVVALNTALMGYITMYGAGVAHINGGLSVSDAVRKLNQDPAFAAPLAENRRRVEVKKRAAVADRPMHDLPTILSAGKTLPESSALNVITVGSPDGSFN